MRVPLAVSPRPPGSPGEPTRAPQAHVLVAICMRFCKGKEGKGCEGLAGWARLGGPRHCPSLSQPRLFALLDEDASAAFSTSTGPLLAPAPLQKVLTFAECGKVASREATGDAATHGSKRETWTYTSPLSLWPLPSPRFQQSPPESSSPPLLFRLYFVQVPFQ